MRSAAVQASPNGTITTSARFEPFLVASPAAAAAAAAYLQRAALVFIFAAIGLRAVVAHRGPYGNMYEFSLAFGATVTLAYYVVGRAYPVRALGALTMGIASAIMLYAVSRPADEKSVDGLIPALQSKWIAIHVPMAIIAYGFFAVAFVAGAVYLLQERLTSPHLPSLEVLDEVGYRAVIVGFPLMFAAIVLGGVWAAEAWGGFWTWDPKETAALATWLIYAFYIHARSVRGLRGRGAAAILVLGFAATLFTFFGNYFFTGLHSFIGPGGKGGA
ncbi:MAG: c-type cytochrome biogenesis protein CcsB [Verrucomicrobiota bacterium]|nr:c-type cytochrome biogenesis protein CcsB [Verrucomicrobiota bacterium]